MLPFVNSIGMKFVPVPAGKYTMGLSAAELDITLRENFPAHPVAITGQRAMSAYLVTVAQWALVMSIASPSSNDVGSLPMTHVSWHEAQMFCARLSDLPAERMAERVYRLPTEAEWEYMCRAGGTGLYTYGVTEDNLYEFAWYEGSWSRNLSKKEYRELARRRGMPVGQLLPNQWDMYDMHGNVYEWCLDTYDDTLFQYIDGRFTENPVHLAYADRAESRAVVRSGSLLSPAIECGCPVRLPFGRSRTGRYAHLGFRVALDDPSVGLFSVTSLDHHDMG